MLVSMLILASVTEAFYICSSSSCSAGGWLDKGTGHRRKVTLGAQQKGQEGRAGDCGQLERGMQHSAAQGCKGGYKYNINRSLPRCMLEWCEMPHMRGVCCIIVTKEACGDALLKTCLASSLAKKRTICKFSFLLCLQKNRLRPSWLWGKYVEVLVCTSAK